TAPVLATVTLNSYAPTTNATLTASVTSSDADSDTVTYTYAWYVNGSVVASTSASLSGATYFDRDDTVYVRVTPTDGTTSGTAMSSSTATVANTAPTLTSVAISPTTAYTGNTLTCTPSGGADVDGDSLSYGYAWTVNGTAAGTSSTLSSGFSRGSVVVCTVTPNDGTTAGTAVASSSLTIANTAPVLASVTLTPTTASATSTMTCSPGTTTDADGTTSFTYAYRWTVNGSAATGSSSTLSGAFVGGNTVRCYATPNDGTGSGAEVASSIVTIGNTAPVLASVTLTPTTASAASTMSCAPGATSDADGTTSFTYAYRWTVNGSAVTGTTSTLAGAFAGGNTVRCYATPNDGTSAGAEVGSDTVTIGNSTPVLASVSLTPTTAYEASTLTCAPGSTTDADGTTSFSYTYAWYVNGSAISATSTTLTGTSFSRGNTVYCRATPSDGVGAGSAVSSSTVTISNSAPTLATVTLDSYAPTTNATLTASATSTDSDSDTVTYTYAWYVNGSLIAPTTSTLSGATYFGRGDTVYVRVTPTDGTTAGTAMSSSTATVANTVPVLSAVSVTPTTAYEASTLTCTPTASDADSDTITYAYAWYVNSSVIAPTTSTLTGTYFGSGNTVYCRVTPSDSTGAGTAVSASTVTIANTAPVLSSVTLTPTTAYEASTLTCAPTATDADGTTPTYTYNWYVNSALIAPVTSTLTGTYFSKGNTVYCRVTPSDGTTSGTAVSSTTVTISNTAPVMSSVTLSPTLVYTNDTITTSVASTDADGDTVSYSYAWYVNGSLIAPTSSSLSGATYFSKTNTVYVRVTPTDGTTSGTASTSSTVTIGNSTPVAPVVAITPEDPEAALDPLVCSISTAASDVDGDSLTYSFTWTKNGSSYTGDTDTSTTSTVPASATAATNIFVCQVTASDGSATSSTATDTLTVLGASYTLGNTTDYPSTGNNATNYLFAQSVTISSAVQLYEMGQQYDIVGTGTEVKFALYTNSAGAPGTLVAYTAAGTPTSTGTFEIEIVGAPVSVAAGTYWMVWSHGTANGRTSYASSGYATNVTYYKARSFTTAFPSSFGSASSLTGQAYNLYAVVR
ncbi:MAG: hypothetical protein Q8P18_21835, partial [Pseudomonadota bacterium]|nr:hypothetical protein [Pseudomonadota bacterium]